MRLTRFCSRSEYDKFICGKTLVNHTDHYRGGKGGSTSVGFCFASDNPKTAWRYLKGLVDCDVCMVVEIDPTLLTKSNGRYVDYSRKNFICYKDEYCLQTYSDKTVKLVKTVPMTDIAPVYEIEAARMIRELMRDDKPKTVKIDL